jgi:uncharacterized BrkB/YihY/UPF0761 family membrane protein
MKTCEEFQEMISAYSDNELNDAETSRLFFHLGECVECRKFMGTLISLRSAIRETADEIIQEKESHSFWKKKIFVSYPVAAILAVMMFASGLMLYAKITEPPRIVERTQTEYVYMAPYPAVYVYSNSTNEVKTN